MANGRCAYHGGRTPKGAGWHKPRWPNGDAPDFEKKLSRKIANQQRAAKKRAARLAAMSPEERKQHEAWHRARQPGAAEKRTAWRRERQWAKEASEIAARPAEPDPAAGELQRELERLRKIADELEQREPPVDIFS